MLGGIVVNNAILLVGQSSRLLRDVLFHRNAAKRAKVMRA